jgi:hypothetical protein
MTIDEWTETYRTCWETADATGVTALFTEDATYRDDIFGEPHVGHAGIEAYWRGVTEHQENVSVRMGTPIVGPERTVVEWWTTMTAGGAEITLPGCLLLRFDEDGLCTELEEYWRTADGIVDPPDNWGR